MSDDLAPEISVLMTVFNTAGFLHEAIESVLSQQTQRSWELIIVDDGSTDGSREIASGYAHRFPRTVRALHHPHDENQGISASRNLALRHARALRTAFLDSDDIWLPHALETLADLLDAHPAAAMVYTGAERWVHFGRAFDEPNARGATWGDNYLPPIIPRCGSFGVQPRGTLLRWFRADESFTPCICSVMVRTAAARAEGGFCERFAGLYDDQAFHAKMSLRHQVVAQDGCVARYRQHERSCCAQARADEPSATRERERFNEFLRDEHAVIAEAAR